MTDNKPLIPDVPFHSGPVNRLTLKLIRHDMSNQQGSQSLLDIEDINPNINLDFKENSSISGGCYVQNFLKTAQVIFSRT